MVFYSLTSSVVIAMTLVELAALLHMHTPLGVTGYLKPKEAGYAALYSLVTHEDKFLDASQKLTLEKVSFSLQSRFNDSSHYRYSYRLSNFTACSLHSHACR